MKFCLTLLALSLLSISAHAAFEELATMTHPDLVQMLETFKAVRRTQNDLGNPKTFMHTSTAKYSALAAEETLGSLVKTFATDFYKDKFKPTDELIFKETHHHSIPYEAAANSLMAMTDLNVEKWLPFMNATKQFASPTNVCAYIPENCHTAKFVRRKN